MKTKLFLINRMNHLIGASSLALTLVLPATAIERPGDAIPQQENRRAEVAKEEANPEKKVAMLGLGGAPVSKTLSMHLGLEQGTGLTLFHIVPDSAAAKAGLQAHDVITHFNGVPIGSQQQLREQIFKHQPGDEVEVKFIHNGKAKQKKVALGERPDHLKVKRGGDGINPKWMFKGLGGDIPEAERKLIEDQMKEQIEKLQKQFKKEGMMELRLDNMGAGAPKDGKAAAGGFQMNAASSISISDGEGMITMKTANGKKDIVVKDKAGEVVYEGPYDTAQDKAAVPDDIRERLKKLKLGEQGAQGFKLRLAPGAMADPPPVRNEDEDAQ